MQVVATCWLAGRRIRTPVIALALAALCATSALPAEERTTSPPRSLAPKQSAPIVFTQVPVSTEIGRDPADDAAGLAVGSRIALWDPSQPEKPAQNLTPGFLAAGGADVSFDGRRILFVGKRKSGEPVGVWEMGSRGGDARCIVQRSTDCTQARYLSTIYTIDADQPEYQICFCTRDDDGISSIHTCRLNGEGARRITFGPAGARDPTPLHDGRLLYRCAQPMEALGQTPGADMSRLKASVLFTVNTDGTDVAAFAGAGEPPAVRIMPCETPQHSVIYVEAPLQPGATIGDRLITVASSGSLHGAESIAGLPAGCYRTPSALADGRILVSRRRTDSATFGIYILDPRQDSAIEPLIDTPGWHAWGGTALAPRAELAGRSSVVDPRVNYGYLYGLNAYWSDSTASNPLAPGQIKEVEIFRAAERGAGSASQTHRQDDGPPPEDRLLGRAPVEQDGSFFLKVPAGVPLRLRTRDADGRVLQAMRNWIWVMPMEGRGCIGCHEDRELSPPNQRALALQAPPHAVGVAPDSRGGPSRGQSAKAMAYPAQTDERGTP